MNTTALLAISQVLSGVIEVWRHHAGKAADWKPTAADWDALLSLNDKTADDYKREAAERLNGDANGNV